jgi:hypothetical protein
MLPEHFICMAEFSQDGQNVKLERCRHCGKTGMLILHGYMYGYDEYRDTRVIKGRRVFCSNRNRRRGCGRTWSCRIIDFMHRTLITTGIAWQFLLFILSGMTIEKAYGALDPACVLSLSTFFRFWTRFKRALHHIRTYLAGHYSLAPVHERSVMHETIRHLALHLADTEADPIANYQKRSQSAFV